MSLRNMLKPVETPLKPGSLFTKFHKASAFSVDFLLFGSSFCMFLSRAFPQVTKNTAEHGVMWAVLIQASLDCNFSSPLKTLIKHRSRSHSKPNWHLV